MKLVHLSDLHIGRRLGGFSLLEDQAYILQEILRIIDAERPNGVLIAGDIYDKAVPAAEAVRLFDSFLTQLQARAVQAFIISGNHDSPDRIAFGGRLMAPSGIHMSPVYEGQITPLTLTDAHGPVHIYMLPFLRPSLVRQFLPEEQRDAIASYTDAYRAAIAQMAVDPAVRNVLVAHAFVTGAARSESEDISIGGADNVDGSVFDCFDYVALGHLHKPQNVGSERIRYCGTPLKYDFSEITQEKSVTVVELLEKGSLAVRTVPLRPLRELRQERGTYMELTARDHYSGTNTEDFLHISLTDEEDVPNALHKLRVIYPNIVKLTYDNTRTRHSGQVSASGDVPKLEPQDIFAALYEQQNGQPMSQTQTQFLLDLMETLREVETCDRLI